MIRISRYLSRPNKRNPDTTSGALWGKQ
jgi:hypothetical protein